LGLIAFALHQISELLVNMLSLLAIAIRNSWAIAIDVVSTPPRRDN
jgi:hypothetical protein